jgi:hypothetical protein
MTPNQGGEMSEVTQQVDAAAEKRAAKKAQKAQPETSKPGPKPRASGLPPELEAEIEKVATHLANGSVRHAAMIRNEIIASIEADLSEHAKTFQGKVADRYFEALKARIPAA